MVELIKNWLEGDELKEHSVSNWCRDGTHGLPKKHAFLGVKWHQH